MPLLTQQLRTTDAAKIPASLEPGQIAFNLANKWMFVGVGGADILVENVAVGGYSATATILGVPNVSVPVKPAAGKGYEIFALEGPNGVEMGAVNPTVGMQKGDLFVNTAGPSLLIYDGANWVPPLASPSVYTLTTAEVTAGAGASQSAKMVAALITKVAAVTAAGDLNTGDTAIVTGTAATNSAPGTFVWDGTNWVATGAGLPDATDAIKGVVLLARDTDVLEGGAATATTPNPLAVATAAQVKALAAQLGTVTTGHALMGTYDASSSQIASANPVAATGGRTGLTVGAQLTPASGVKAGDYFVVTVGGTIAGESPALNVAVAAGDQLVYDGASWHVVAINVAGGNTLFALNDVDSSAAQTVAPANAGGLLMRDSTIANGLPGSWKQVGVLDLGSF